MKYLNSVVAFVVALAVVCVYSEDFHPDRVHLVDWTPNGSGYKNYLFRGNEPIENGRLCYDDLVSTLRSVAISEGGFYLPETFYILDLSLLDEEERNIQEEKHYWENNPTEGEMKRWPTIGQIIAPESIPEPKRKEMAQNLTIDKDHLIQRMIKLRDALFTSYDVGPVVIYYHCEAGVDRTGEISGAYYIRWLGWSFDQALDYDNSIESRDMENVSRNAMQWYCYHLFYWEGYSLDCDLPANVTASSA
eukprot:CAMPEP_0201523496 /NCGR_PEP_ID=MMETSP0161_2-20130828/20110_1 /ASSEMBLY_ACC=CAM_ASM_000251 /TAXON_ID=180227 /ORGANISM="Neoparamoeba aestuarina, Strain SoJaBio B1-5/56/2" /LENGTH=247 /DNA_ID=CAMNT_0047922641 /DNA_START=37 /DNA_END=780 /DNA_ORIENTATION=+